jgi:hypothetical protein
MNTPSGILEAGSLILFRMGEKEVQIPRFVLMGGVTSPGLSQMRANAPGRAGRRGLPGTTSCHRRDLPERAI